MPTLEISSYALKLALYPAESESKHKTTSPCCPVNRFNRFTCFSLRAVPNGATTFSIPFSKHLIKSSWPSQIMTDSFLAIERLLLFKPKKNIALFKS